MVFGGGQVGRKLGMGLSLGWLECLDVGNVLSPWGLFDDKIGGGGGR